MRLAGHSNPVIFDTAPDSDVSFEKPPAQWKISLPLLLIFNIQNERRNCKTGIVESLHKTVEEEHSSHKRRLHLTRKEEKNDLITIGRWEKQSSEESDDTESETTDSDGDDHLQHQQEQENSSQLPNVVIMHDSVLKDVEAERHQYYDRKKNTQSYNQTWTHSYNKQPYRRNYSTNDENVTYIGRQRGLVIQGTYNLKANRARGLVIQGTYNLKANRVRGLVIQRTYNLKANRARGLIIQRTYNLKANRGAGTERTAGVVEVQSTRRSVSALTQVWPVGASDRRRVWRGPWCAWASAIRRGSPSHFPTADQTGWWRLTLCSRL
ncbi:hypothetical protein ACOMHN_025850 [Nucella lapillus]